MTWSSASRPTCRDLNPDVELVVYRVAQEALTNVARHSGADRPSSTLVTDDGRAGADGQRPRTRAAAGLHARHRDARDARAGDAVGATLNGRRLAPSARAARSGSTCRWRTGDEPDSTQDPDPARRRPRGRPPRTADGARCASRTSRWSPRPVTAPRPSRGPSAEDIDLAIVDISMPRMTGLQAVRELHRRRPAAADPDPLDAPERAVPVRGAQGRRVRLRAQDGRRPRSRRGLPGGDARRAVPVSGRDDAADPGVPAAERGPISRCARSR